MTIILGIDQASLTGMARIDRRTDGTPECHIRDDLDLTYEKDPCKRMVRYRDWLNGVFLRVKPDLVVFEKPHLRGGGTYFLAGLRTINILTCYDFGVTFIEVQTSTLKKFATGSGRADKGGMIEAVRQRLGIDCRTDNQADAMLLAYYGWIQHLNFRPHPNDIQRP